MENEFFVPGVSGVSWGKSQEPSKTVTTSSSQSTAADQVPVARPYSVTYDASLDTRHRDHERRIDSLEKTVQRLTEILEASEGVIELRDISYEQARQEISQYFRDHHGDEIDAGTLQEELGIELSMAMKICQELEQAGRIKEL